MVVGNATPTAPSPALRDGVRVFMAKIAGGRLVGRIEFAPCVSAIDFPDSQ